MLTPGVRGELDDWLPAFPRAHTVGGVSGTEEQRESTVALRPRAAEPPTGWSRLRWWGPGFLWAMSAVGSGSVLFTPRVGAEYGYAFIWLLLGVAFLMWIMIREAGRFAVVTGRTLLDGYTTLPGPRNWALWAVFAPQLVAAVAGVAGLTALVGSVLSAELPGSLLIWSLITLAITTLVVVSGGYGAISRIALMLALALVAVTVVAAVRVYTLDPDLAQGLLPNVPVNTDIPFLLPWVGTILAGSMGIIWFSYWAAARGYGGERVGVDENDGSGSGESDDVSGAQVNNKLMSWFGTLSNTAAVGVITGTIVIVSFLVLGTELLQPAGIVPSGTDVADDLTRLLSEVWGTVGHWLMVAAILITLLGSVLANQDGWSRSFADIVLLLSRRRREISATDDALDARSRGLPAPVSRLLGVLPGAPGPYRGLKILFAIVITAVLPAVVIAVVRNPVTIMSASGIVAAVHTPLIVFATLAVNRRLPGPVRPGAAVTVLMCIAGSFYLIFAMLYFANLIGLIGR